LEPEEVLLKEVAIDVEVWLRSVRDPETDRLGPQRGAVRKHTDDGHGAIVDAHHAADDCRVRVEVISPDGLIDDRHRWLVRRTAIIGIEKATENGAVDPFHLKEVAAYGEARSTRGVVVSDEGAEDPIGGELADGAVAIAEGCVFGIGHEADAPVTGVFG